jgi:hypothetical protein
MRLSGAIWGAASGKVAAVAVEYRQKREDRTAKAIQEAREKLASAFSDVANLAERVSRAAREVEKLDTYSSGPPDEEKRRAAELNEARDWQRQIERKFEGKLFTALRNLKKYEPEGDTAANLRAVSTAASRLWGELERRDANPTIDRAKLELSGLPGLQERVKAILAPIDQVEAAEARRLDRQREFESAERQKVADAEFYARQRAFLATPEGQAQSEAEAQKQAQRQADHQAQLQAKWDRQQAAPTAPDLPKPAPPTAPKPAAKPEPTPQYRSPTPGD